MNEFISFGSPDLFEISARWTVDAESRDRLPLESGWSTGDLRITVGRQVLTARTFNDSDEGYISWYLSPVFDWLISQWTWIFHEERYAWPDRIGAPAAIATVSALGRSIALLDEFELEEYRVVQSWWKRHALRAADSSALYPDIFFRRLGDEIEVSWGGRQPAYAPEGFLLNLSPGYATFDVEVVVKPLWEFLKWGLSTAKAGCEHDKTTISDLRNRFDSLKKTPLKNLEIKYLGTHLKSMLDKARSGINFEADQKVVKGVPAIEYFDSAVLMFGGLNPDINTHDAKKIMQFMVSHQSGSCENDLLSSLVEDRRYNSSLEPYQDGYELAEEVRDQLEIAPKEAYLNIRDFLSRMQISVEEVALDTDSVRGLAVAGKGFSPAILINTSNAFNKTEDGRRFTLAHEFCHILFDRSRAKKLSHSSGPWTAPRCEKRANAFAAMFLASRSAARHIMKGRNPEEIVPMAKKMRIGISALIEHLYNIGLINDFDREQLRTHAS